MVLVKALLMMLTQTKESNLSLHPTTEPTGQNDGVQQLSCCCLSSWIWAQIHFRVFHFLQSSGTCELYFPKQEKQTTLMGRTMQTTF